MGWAAANVPVTRCAPIGSLTSGADLKTMSLGGSEVGSRGSQNLWQIRAYQIAALRHAVCIAPRAIAIKLLFPFHHVCLAAVFLDELADAITALARAPGAFDAQHLELALDVTEDEISPGRP
jgi:hypothetical protein